MPCWLNEERTVLVQMWEDGSMTIATRPDPWATWGPPTRLLLEGGGRVSEEAA